MKKQEMKCFYCEKKMDRPGAIVMVEAMNYSFCQACYEKKAIIEKIKHHRLSNHTEFKEDK